MVVIHHPSRAKKFKKACSIKKLVTTVMLVKFCDHETTVTTDLYFETLRNLRRDTQNKPRRMISQQILFLHDNTLPDHTQISSE